MLTSGTLFPQVAGVILVVFKTRLVVGVLSYIVIRISITFLMFLHFILFQEWNHFQASMDKINLKHADKKIITHHNKPFWTNELTSLSNAPKTIRDYIPRKHNTEE